LLDSKFFPTKKRRSAVFPDLPAHLEAIGLPRLSYSFPLASEAANDPGFATGLAAKPCRFRKVRTPLRQKNSSSGKRKSHPKLLYCWK
jgi:hypothetical protein